MKTLRWATKNMNVLNGLLLLALGVLAYYGLVPSLNVTIPTDLPTLGKAETAAINQPAPPPKPLFTDYVAVSNENLFHPERRVPPDKKETDKAVIPRPDLVLSGTLIADDLSIAYIEDKRALFSTPGRGKRPRPAKKGDTIGGYVLREIRATSIILANGQDQMVVTLDEKDKKRGGETAPALAASPSSSPASGFPQAAAGQPSASVSPVPTAAPQAPSAAALGFGSSSNAPPARWPQPPLRRPPYGR